MTIPLQKLVFPKSPFTPLSLNKTLKPCPITIYPREVIFQDIANNSCYEIDLWIRNQSSQMQTLRIIGPRQSHFRMKTQDGLIKKVAQGLAMKISVLFCVQKIGAHKVFEEKIIVSGDSFKEVIPIKALAPREQLLIPSVINVGRLLVGQDNLRTLSVKNQGKKAASLHCECYLNSITILAPEKKIQPGQTIKFDLKLKSKKAGPIQDKVKFSNGTQCEITGIFVEEGIELFGQEGDKLMMIDIGQLLVGEKISQKVFLLNNSNKKIQGIFKTFNKNIEITQIKVDEVRQNFIIRCLPEQYAKQFKKSFSSIQSQKLSIAPYSQCQNTLTIYNNPTPAQIKLHHDYISNAFDDEIMEEPKIQTLIVTTFGCKHSFKVPIKFISVLPQLRVNSRVIQFGQIKERADVFKEIIFDNQGEKDIALTIQTPHGITIQGDNVIKARKRQMMRVCLRAVKAGKIQQSINFKIFEGLGIEVKVFATCRSSSIRTKKYANLNSTRDFKSQFKLYETLATCRHQRNNDLSSIQSVGNLNRTDVLSDLRIARKDKRIKQLLHTDSQPQLIEPKMNLTNQVSAFKVQIPKRDLFAKSNMTERQAKLSLKDIAKYSHALKVQELANITLQESQVAFGTIFIEAEVTKQIKVFNRNLQPVIFQWDTAKNFALSGTSTQPVKIDGRSQRQFTIKFKPNLLGTACLPLNYIINRNHIFQLYITAFVTLVNIDISTKTVQLGFDAYDTTFQKQKEIQLSNKGNSIVRCSLKMQEGRHFSVNTENLELGPNSKQKIVVTYKPIENEQGPLERTDIDKFVVKIIGGAQNVIKCTGTITDARVTVKENDITCLQHLVSIPFYGKLNIKNLNKAECLYKIQIPTQLSQVLTFDKLSNILCAQEKKQLNYTLLSHIPKKIQSHIFLHLRAGKSLKIPLECSFVLPQIETSIKYLDFGNIPIMGSNYKEILTVTNLHKNEVKLELGKKAESQEYAVEVKVLRDNEEQDRKTKKKTTGVKEQFSKQKRDKGPKTIKLLPNVQTKLQIKFVPKKLKLFDIPLPLRLYGTSQNEVLPIPTNLICTSIEPIVYLHPQKISFQTRIIGEGKTSFTKSFQIRNPHDYQIEWKIENREQERNSCLNGNGFWLNETEGIISAKGTVQLDVVFKPQSQGHFGQKLDVTLKQKKISHIALQLEGHAIFPSLKFGVNELLMPAAPLKVQSRALVLVQNHGYEAITVSKWKIANNFGMVDFVVNFIEGRLLSLAKKTLKVQIVCSSSFPISFTTMMQFYDEFGTKYQLPISCTFDNSLMTTYPFLEAQSSNIIYDKKDSTVKMLPCQANYIDLQQNSEKEQHSCEFIKNWLNYELNIGVKSFPSCFVESQSELFYRMVTRMAGCQLVRRFEGAHSENFYQNIYSYYSESIRILKTQGAFLNQIRPEYLLTYADYKTYLNSKNMIVQPEQAFHSISISAWTALFYQLCKLYILSQATQKMILKFSPSPSSLTSTVYSPQELLILKFINSFSNDQAIYHYNDRIRFIEAIQFSLQKVLNIKLTNSLMSMKISVVVMTPGLFVSMLAKYIYDTLKEYGLNLFLMENDLEVLGPKELTLFLVSYIGMLYQYASTSKICFQASVGDKVTKIIQIDNPVNRKAKYRVKLEGSTEFALQQQEIVLKPRSKEELRVVYHCKQNKQQQAKLFLVPEKQDIHSASVHPLAFKLSTSIISKITLKKISLTANLYDITTITLQAELPIDIIQLAQFQVTLVDADENAPSFYCFQQLNRTLKSSHDKLDIKLVPMSMGYKYCSVTYRSNQFGQFNFQISAKIEPPVLHREIKLKQLKVNKEEIVPISIPRENQQLANAQKYLSDHHCRLPEQNQLLQTKRSTVTNKYVMNIVQSSYISVAEESAELPKTQLEGKENINIDLKCLFGKPFTEYTCTLMVKNQVLRDVRYYKLITSVAMKPKIVDMQIRAKARQFTSIKIPIKNTPCELSFQNTCQYFKISNFQPHIRQPTELSAVFSPQWMLHKQLTLVAQNKQTLEQVIYQIELKGEEPAFFDNLKVTGSAVFERKVKIGLNLMGVNEELRVQCESSRVKLEENSKYGMYKRWVNATILPGPANTVQQLSSIKLIKQKSSQYYWASLTVINQKITQLKEMLLEESPNNVKSYLFEDITLDSDYQINCQKGVQGFFSYKVVKKYGGYKLMFEFRPYKEMEKNVRIYLMNKEKQYEINIKCKANALPIITLPEIYSINMANKNSTINVVNNSSLKGVYSASVDPENLFKLDHSTFEILPNEKKEIKIVYSPQYIHCRTKAVVKFTSENLPTYEYHFSAVSEFKNIEKTIQCEYYTEKNTFKDIYFTNWFQNQETFEIVQKLDKTPFEIIQPKDKKITLQSGATKRILIKVGQVAGKKDIGNGRIVIKLNEKCWGYTLLPLEIKNLNKKINWNCIARQVCYQNIELPSDIVVKSIESSPQLQPYLSYTTQQGTNVLKLKFSPLKPIAKDQYQILLSTDSSKYLLNTTVHVEMAPPDDTIYIKTKQLSETGCISFKLTNTKKMNAPFKAFFLKNLPDLSVQVEKGYLESYGRIGTNIFVKFTSNVFNKRVQDQLWIQTQEMLWRFKVVGLLSKKHFGK